MTPTFRDLERKALAAHERGERWQVFWARVAHEVRRLAPYDRQRFRNIYNRLLHLLMTGDDAGREPPGNGLPPWDLDATLDEANTSMVTGPFQRTGRSRAVGNVPSLGSVCPSHRNGTHEQHEIEA